MTTFKFCASSKKDAINKIKEKNKDNASMHYSISNIRLSNNKNKSEICKRHRGQKLYQTTVKYYPEKDIDWG